VTKKTKSSRNTLLQALSVLEEMSESGRKVHVMVVGLGPVSMLTFEC
jgi:hypothetical protein